MHGGRRTDVGNGFTYLESFSTFNVDVILMISHLFRRVNTIKWTDSSFNSRSWDVRRQILCRGVPENQFCFTILLSSNDSSLKKLKVVAFRWLNFSFWGWECFNFHLDIVCDRMFLEVASTERSCEQTIPMICSECGAFSFTFSSGYHVNGIIFFLPKKRNQKKIECRKIFIYFTFRPSHRKGVWVKYSFPIRRPFVLLQ
jgi:hypothetical protein